MEPKRFWTSDLHFGHANILNFTSRPYWTVEGMNEGIINEWNNIVRPIDEVWVVGDVAMGKIAETLPLVKRLNGRKVLIPGNHDRCWRGDPKWENKPNQPEFAEFNNWTEVYHGMGFNEIRHAYPSQNIVTTINGLQVNVSHFPYEGDSRDEDRFNGFRMDNDGKWIIHGHIHSASKVNEQRTQIHIGWDAWHKPVSDDEIWEIMNGTS